MTPKEKAQELIEKFKTVRLSEKYQMNNGDGHYDIMDRMFMMETSEAKQCALIAVNTALFAVTEFANYEGEAYHFEEYWNEVKQELEKL